MVPEAHVTIFDTKTLSVGEGWQVEAALRAARAGWSLERTLGLLERVRAATQTFFTVATLRYLIHGGRISHIKGLLAQVLNIKPVIGVEKERGTYVQHAQARTFKGAVRSVVDHMAKSHAPGSRLRVQVVHALNPEGAEMLHDEISARFECAWLPVGPMSYVLGAHTGPSMIGVAYASAEGFEGRV
jgi:DegV family protein with EDD domain